MSWTDRDHLTHRESFPRALFAGECGEIRARLAGVQAPFHPDWRTDCAGPSRADEIQRWLAGHSAPPSVILDDWPAQLAGMLGRTVVPHFQIGLTAQDCAAALAILATTT